MIKKIRVFAQYLVSGVLSVSLCVSLVSFATSAWAAGDAAAGEQKAVACFGCHGQAGNSTMPSFPKLAGQGERYLVKQLADIKSGARKADAMASIAANLSEQDMADLAAYFVKQKSSLGGVKKDQLELGQKVYRAGIAEKGVTACAACHGANGLGLAGAGFPSLSGQHEAYVVAQLKAFRAAGRGDKEGAKRENDGDGRMMRNIAAQLSDTEIDALANYISGLH